MVRHTASLCLDIRPASMLDMFRYSICFNVNVCYCASMFDLCSIQYQFVDLLCSISHYTLYEAANAEKSLSVQG